MQRCWVSSSCFKLKVCWGTKQGGRLLVTRLGGGACAPCDIPCCSTRTFCERKPACKERDRNKSWTVLTAAELIGRLETQITVRGQWRICSSNLLRRGNYPQVKLTGPSAVIKLRWGGQEEEAGLRSVRQSWQLMDKWLVSQNHVRTKQKNKTKQPTA